MFFEVSNDIAGAHGRHGVIHLYNTCTGLAKANYHPTSIPKPQFKVNLRYRGKIAINLK